MPARRRIARVAIYARLSVTTEESVSIERQVTAARKYAEARGWEVVLERTDDGVSATKNRPEDRPGWRGILDAPETYDAVIVWKVDRLARRVLDFLHADEALQARGAGIVAVEDPVDMTTAQGRAFATMLAVFGEMEAAAISARVTDARRAIVHAGRRAGGRPPFGWHNVPNKSGPGLVLAKDPARIGVVETLARRALEGESLYSLTRWLEAEGVPPRARDGRKDAARWHESSVETILRNPALAGLTPYRADVVRGPDGVPVVDESVAILTTTERRRLLAVLDERKAPGSRAYATKSGSGLLSGLIRCASCEKPMHRATVAARYPYYRCQNKACSAPVGVSRPTVEGLVVETVLGLVGDLPAVAEEFDDVPDAAPLLADVEAAIADTLARMADDDADVPALAARLATLKETRSRARADAEAAPSVRSVPLGRTFREVWEASEDDEARRLNLSSAVAAVFVAKSDRKGRTLDPDRVRVILREDRSDLDGETSAASREYLAARYPDRFREVVEA